MKTINILIILGVVLIIGVGISIQQNNNNINNNINSNNFNNIDFFTSYTIATNYIDLVIQKQKMIEINYKYYNKYIYQSEGYIYDIASIYLDDSLSSLEGTKETLAKSKNKLLMIKNSSPDDFYDIEIKLRLKQIDLLMNISEKRIQMMNLSNEILYEVNNGSKKRVKELTIDLNDLIEEFNLDIENSIEIENQIDIHWLEDFYPN